MKDGFITVGVATPKVRVADCAFNAAQTIAVMNEAQQKGVLLLVFPELGLTAYTCGDLFLQQTLLDGARKALLSVIEASRNLNLVAIVGVPLLWHDKLYDCAAVVCRGKLLGVVPKTYLPNHEEFYEQRWFIPAPKEQSTITLFGMSCPFGADLIFQCEEAADLTFAVEICEDLWSFSPPSIRHAQAGALIIANLSASNELVGKAAYRRQLVGGQSARLICGYLYAGAGSGESTTDLVFASARMIAENGVFLAQGQSGTDGLLVSEVDIQNLATQRRRNMTFRTDFIETHLYIPFSHPVQETVLTRSYPRHPFVPAEGIDRQEHCQTILMVQAIGLAKRLEHVGSKRVVVGISGGLDSTLALLVAVEAFDRLVLPRKGIIAVTMPCFGTTDRTRSNAEKLGSALGVTVRTVDITQAVLQHFSDIGHDPSVHDVTFENAQARERTQVLMDIANTESALVIGTSDMSELALGWSTYNGDHMSMYGVNASVPKTLVRYLVAFYAETHSIESLRNVLFDILDTPVSPELLPAHNGKIAQKTEDIIGPYELHDFFLYYTIRGGFGPKKLLRVAQRTFGDTYERKTIIKWLRVFYSRFFSQQFKRSCLPDGPKVGSVALSPRGDWRMPSDGCVTLWMNELDQL